VASAEISTPQCRHGLRIADSITFSTFKNRSTCSGFLLFIFFDSLFTHFGYYGMHRVFMSGLNMLREI
jgi:hypothetical protein